MTQQRDITSLLDIWLGEGSNVAPDRVIDVVTDRIERQRQRGTWRFPRRDFRMPALLRVAAVATAIVVLGAGAIFFAGSPQPSVSPASPAPPPTVAASTGPSPSPYVLASGLPYETQRTITTEFRPSFRMDVPTGWAGSAGTSSLGLSLGLIHSDEFGDSGNVGGSILIRSNPVLGNINSCPAERTAAPTLGPSTPAAEIVASLRADPRFAVVAGSPIAIDGRPAQVLDVQLAPGFTGSCMGDLGGASALLFDEPGSFIVLDDDQRARLILLDVDDVPLLILIWPSEEGYDAFVARSMALIDGITFLP